MSNEEILRSFVDDSSLHPLNLDLIYEGLTEHILSSEEIFMFRDTYVDRVSGILVVTSRKLIHANVSKAFLSSDVEVKAMPYREIRSIDSNDDEVRIVIGAEIVEYSSFGGSKSTGTMVDLVKDYIQ